MALFHSEWEELLKKSQPSNLPDSIAFDILSRLPVKSILRFKCVCKKWLVLFRDPEFADTHLNRSIDCYLHGFYPRDRTGSRRGVSFFLRSGENLERLHELHFQSEPCQFEIAASVNGIVCIAKCDYFESKVYYLQILLWNPATRELRILPKFPGQKEYYNINHRKMVDTRLGFVFDSRNNDYKTVAITRIEKSVVVNIYSLRTDSWTTLSGVDTLPLLQKTMAVNVNGRMHWYGWGKICNLIVSFDVIDEKFTEMDTPLSKTYDTAILCESPARRSLLLCHFRASESGCLTWFMIEYGNSQSWIPLHFCPGCQINGWIAQACLYVDDKRVILPYTEGTFLYDTKNRTRTILNDKSFNQVAKYKQSLVSIKRR